MSKVIKPNANVMKAIGKEMIEGYRGGYMAGNIKVAPNGVVSLTRGRQYPYGIMRGISPNGKAYADLTKRSIQYKRKHGSHYPDRPLIWSATSHPDSLVNALTYRVYSGRDGVETMFKSSELNRLSRIHEEGRQHYYSEVGHLSGVPAITVGGKEDGDPLRVQFPARPHRDVQPAVYQVISRILHAWAKRSS